MRSTSLLPIEYHILWSFSQQGVYHQADSENIIGACVSRERSQRYSHRPKDTLGQIVKPRQQEERCHQYNGRTDERRHLCAGTGLAIDTRAGNGTIGGKRTRHKGPCNVRGAKSNEFSIWTNRIGITSGVLFRSNNTIKKSNDGDESACGCMLMIVKN